MSGADWAVTAGHQALDEQTQHNLDDAAIAAEAAEAARQQAQALQAAAAQNGGQN